MTARSSGGRRPLAGGVISVLVLLLGATACDGTAANKWLSDHGRPTLSGAELSRFAAIATTIEQELARRKAFVGEIQPVTAERLGLSWREGCPLEPKDLRLLRLSYWGMDGTRHTGELIVAESSATKTVTVFRTLWEEKFPINRMETAEKFARPTDFTPSGEFIESHAGPDLVNDTSAFFCRRSTGSTTRWSEHSYGTAIDVNPVNNPYIKGTTIIPINGADFVRRGDQPGVITAKGPVVAAFKKAGFTWGGNWKSLKDYMHFSISGK